MGIEAALRICFLLFLLSASWQDLKKKTIKKSTFQIWGTVGVILQAAHIFSQIFMGTEKMGMQVIVQEQGVRIPPVCRRKVACRIIWRIRI